MRLRRKEEPKPVKEVYYLFRMQYGGGEREVRHISTSHTEADMLKSCKSHVTYLGNKVGVGYGYYEIKRTTQVLSTYAIRRLTYEDGTIITEVNEGNGWRTT